MSNAVATLPEGQLVEVLKASLYPGAADESVLMVLDYCRAAKLDPMQKPVHIVPMWDSKAGRMRDVVMPGVNLYRTQASRSGECAGVTEPDFGPDETADIGGVQITFPTWCRVTVSRRLPTGEIVQFTAREFWRENYAIKGGKEKSVAPNAMWTKRPYGQIAKCAEAQALRKAFPEIASAPTAEEMEGKALQPDAVVPNAGPSEFETLHADALRTAAIEGVDALAKAFKAAEGNGKAAYWTAHGKSLKAAAEAADKARAPVTVNAETGEIVE